MRCSVRMTNTPTPNRQSSTCDYCTRVKLPLPTATFFRWRLGCQPRGALRKSLGVEPSAKLGAIGTTSQGKRQTSIGTTPENACRWAAETDNEEQPSWKWRKSGPNLPCKASNRPCCSSIRQWEPISRVKVLRVGEPALVWPDPFPRQRGAAALERLSPPSALSTRLRAVRIKAAPIARSRTRPFRGLPSTQQLSTAAVRRQHRWSPDLLSGPPPPCTSTRS